MISREASSRRRPSEQETEMQALNKSLMGEKRENEVLHKAVEDQKTQKNKLIDEMHLILIEHKSLHDYCDKQQEKLVQAQKLREQLLRTLLQKDDGKAVQ